MAPVHWIGGKGNMTAKLLPLLPAGRIYVEPYCGAASMFWHLPKPRPVEVLNDLDGEIVNLFRVLQDRKKFSEFSHRLTWTPYAFDEYCKALKMKNGNGNGHSDVDRAWAFFVRQNQGFGGMATGPGSWGRAFNGPRDMAGTCGSWRSRMATLDWWHERLTRVQIDHKDALEIIQYWDGEDTVHYIDPPYVSDARVTKSVYANETDDAHHKKLVEVLLNLKGQAMLSGYDTPIYKPLEKAGWVVKKFQTVCHAAGRTRGSGLQGTGTCKDKVPRIEVAWIKRWEYVERQAKKLSLGRSV